MPTHPEDPVHPNNESVNPGITLREHFACEAMNALLCRSPVCKAESPFCDSYREAADKAVGMADALIVALNRPSVEDSREAERTND